MSNELLDSITENDGVLIIKQNGDVFGFTPACDQVNGKVEFDSPTFKIAVILKFIKSEKQRDEVISELLKDTEEYKNEL